MIEAGHQNIQESSVRTEVVWWSDTQLVERYRARVSNEDLSYQQITRGT